MFSERSRRRNRGCTDACIPRLIFPNSTDADHWADLIPSKKLPSPALFVRPPSFGTVTPGALIPCGQNGPRSVTGHGHARPGRVNDRGAGVAYPARTRTPIMVCKGRLPLRTGCMHYFMASMQDAHPISCLIIFFALLPSLRTGRGEGEGARISIHDGFDGFDGH